MVVVVVTAIVAIAMLIVVVVTVITAAITPQLFCNPNSPLGARHAIWLLAFAQIPHLYVYLLPLFGVTRWDILFLSCNASARRRSACSYSNGWMLADNPSCALAMQVQRTLAALIYRLT